MLQKGEWLCIWMLHKDELLCIWMLHKGEWLCIWMLQKGEWLCIWMLQKGEWLCIWMLKDIDWFFGSVFFILLCYVCILYWIRCRRGRDRMVVIGTYATSAYHHHSCEFQTRSWGGVLDTTLCDKVCQWLEAGQRFSPGTQVSSTNNSDRQDITEILLKVALNTITLTLCWIRIVVLLCCHDNCRCLLNIYMYLQLSIISGHTWRSIGYFNKFTSQENVPEILRLKN